MCFAVFNIRIFLSFIFPDQLRQAVTCKTKIDDPAYKRIPDEYQHIIKVSSTNVFVSSILDTHPNCRSKFASNRIIIVIRRTLDEFYFCKQFGRLPNMDFLLLLHLGMPYAGNESYLLFQKRNNNDKDFYLRPYNEADD